jgi:predicted KAP-like P-loop ATPase
MVFQVVLYFLGWRVSVWSDTESSVDYLNFGEVAEIASDIISSSSLLPVSIGIFGNWGSGKSSILRLIENRLREKSEHYLIIKFDAWLYQGYDDARLSLMETIVSSITNEVKENEGLIKKAITLFSRIDYFRLFGLVAEGIALAHGVPTGGVIARSTKMLSGLADGIKTEEEYQNVGTVAKDISGNAFGLLKPLQEKSPPQHIDAFRKEYKEIINDLNKTIIVIIDNLDRCNPINAIQTLEAIRLFLFLNKTAFIISVDEDMIRSSVKEYFKGLNDKHQIDYLDKLIQIPIRVPKVGIREIKAYLYMLYTLEHGIQNDKIENLRNTLESNLRSSWKDAPLDRNTLLNLFAEDEQKKLMKSYELADRISPLLANSPMIQGNPRIVKRLLNVIKMRSQIAKRRNMPLDEALITKLVIFERCVGSEITSDFYRLIDSEKGKPNLLQIEGNNEFMNNLPELWKNKDLKNFISEWMKLEPNLKNIDLRPALYLSRETRSLGIDTKELSNNAKDILIGLLELKNISSPSITPKLVSLSLDEQVIIMENLIDHLRQVSDWQTRPDGFSGACLLANSSASAAKILLPFFKDLESQNKPWMRAAFKTLEWYK